MVLPEGATVKNIQTICSGCKREVRIPSPYIIIDDEESIYRFRCPEEDCHVWAEKRMDQKIRGVLIKAGCRTLDMIVEEESSHLDDHNRFWKAMFA